MILTIAGMHRSGTSLAASWLQGCGLVIDNGNLIPPHPDNPKGFFEDRDFEGAANYNLLNGLGLQSYIAGQHRLSDPN